MRRLEGEHRVEVAVVGGGIVASAVALELAAAGRRVALITSASAPHDAHDLGHVLTGLLLPYSEACRRHGREAARHAWLALREGHDRLRDRLAALRADCGQEQAGGFRLARDREEARALAEGDELLHEDGFAGEFLDHYMLELRFDLPGFAGAFWVADDGVLDAGRLERTLNEAARGAGAVVFDESPLADLDLAQEVEAVGSRGRVRAETAVLAADVEAARFGPGLEAFLVRRPTLRADLPGPPGPVPSPAVLARGGFRWRAGSGRVAVEAVDQDALTVALGTLGAGATVPRMEGTLGATSDGLPLVGRVPGVPALAACGFGWHSLAAALPGARWVADLLDGRHDTVPALFRWPRAAAGGGAV